MDEDAVRTEMRLYAIEIFVSNLFALSCLSSAPLAPLELCKKATDQMIGGARQRTFPQFDPAMSDFLSGELEAAVTHLASMAGSQISAALEHRSKQR
jgi:hypothetical protein